MVWYGKTPTMRAEKKTLAEQLKELARSEDDGKPKTGRRYYYLALSYGYISPRMGATDEEKKEREAAYKRITDVLGVMRMSGELDWDMVLDLTRELDEWRIYGSPREARAESRRLYDEDRWLRQSWYPILIVEKDTMEPVCKPMASRWQMPFASSRGYSSLRLQHDVADMLNRRFAKTGQIARVYFVSDHDPSGFDLQRAWDEALTNFGVVHKIVRIGLTRDQVRDNVDGRGRSLEGLAIAVKDSDSRSHSYIGEYGRRCWEADILPAHVIEQAIDDDVRGWLNADLWRRRAAEIERARALL
jgi:hypothetical protein